jgi:hypothetical protein
VSAVGRMTQRTGKSPQPDQIVKANPTMNLSFR